MSAAFPSYAQHGEDVVLHRALRTVVKGFYIDVGAHDPEHFSVTKSFYDAGWRGVNIEPEKHCFARLLDQRPRDINLQVLISDAGGEAEFYEVQGTGLSTSDKELADGYRAQNYPVDHVVLPIMTLDEVCAAHAPGEIHFLKVDVEGAEERVLRGASFKRHRPWIIVAEATLPLSAERSDAAVTDYLCSAGYAHIFFDGLNSFYVANEHGDLARFLDRPANPLDRYTSPVQREAAALRKELESIKNSRSWRLTDPMRKIDRRMLGSVRRALEHRRRGRLVRANVKKPLLNFDSVGISATAIDCTKLVFPGYTGQQTVTNQLNSCLCTRELLESDAFRYWVRAMQLPWKVKRKLWEFCFICQALFERGMLAPGRRGLGFAVGEEPLPALFAAMGCDVLATDLEVTDLRATPWAETGQLASSIEKLRNEDICKAADFDARVSFEPLDMNYIPESMRGFDFTWSSCSFEHCGSIDLGLAFLRRQMNCLRPGGVAVHTTEFNLSSNDETIEEGCTVIFRKRDIDKLVEALEKDGHRVEPVCYRLGRTSEDKFVDVFPYGEEPHLKLLLEDRFVSTSIGLIVNRTA